MPAKICPVMLAEKVPRPKMSIAPRQFFLRQQFRQHAVFRRAENRAVRAHQENGGEHQRHVFEPQSERREGHDAEFGTFDGDGYVALAEAVGEKAAGHGEQNERQRERRAPTSGTSESRFSSDKPMPMMKKVTRNLSVLSLKAFWNSTTNISQKLRNRVWRPASGVWCFGFRSRRKAKPSRAKVGIEKLLTGINIANARAKNRFVWPMADVARNKVVKNRRTRKNDFCLDGKPETRKFGRMATRRTQHRWHRSCFSESIMQKNAATMHEPLPDTVSYGSTPLRGIVAKVRNVVKIEIPIGYQDETGFHKGVKPAETEIKWPSVW